jgi:hypothetical protein
MSFPSKLFRAQQRIHQIEEEQQRGDASDDVVHGPSLLKPIAGLRESPTECKKQNSDQYVKCV